MPASHLNSPYILNERNINKKNNLGVEPSLSVHKGNISLWTERWFLSSNAKDIGTLYLIFALFSGLLGTAFSVLIRLELSGPGVQYIEDNQLYNSIITAHAILMIFFMVEKSLNVLNMKSQSLHRDMENDCDNNNVEIGSDNNNNDDKDPKKPISPSGEEGLKIKPLIYTIGLILY